MTGHGRKTFHMGKRVCVFRMVEIGPDLHKFLHSVSNERAFLLIMRPDARDSYILF